VDVIVVGAGMVGAATALALGQAGLQVALLDQRAPQPDWKTEEFDRRVSAITRASQQFFEELGAWPGIVAERLAPYREMQVWDASGDGAIHFDSADIGEPDLGHIIENRVILKALHGQLAATETVQTRWSVELQAMQRDDTSARLELRDGATLEARLIVGADGAASWVRRTAGIVVTGWDYDHVAVVATVKPAQHHRDTAWQRFLPSGPLAFLPLPDGYCSIVWSTSPEHAALLIDMDDADFARELQGAFENRLGPIEQTSARAGFPLRSFETRHYVKTRLALVGDAAHTIHPLAGQGVNLGLADARALRDVLVAARDRRRDPGARTSLRRYERWRRADNRGMLLAMDGFKRLFSSEHPLLRRARNLGLNLTDHLPPLKNLIMQQAMGK
jgi:2-octaprenylphenol hydroxylase